MVRVENFFNRKIVIVKELADNQGSSICNAFESLFKSVTRHFELYPKEVIWIEYWPTWSIEEGGYERLEEEYSLVTYSLTGGYPYNPGWRPLTDVELKSIKLL
jgi:hypothetical protein